MKDFVDINKTCLELQELERKRIASELHDTSLQNLTHIIHQVELSSLYIDNDPIKAKLELEDICVQLRRITQDIRNTIFDIRPMSFDDLGLEQAIDEYILFLKKKYNIRVITNIDDVNYLNEDKKLAIYRVIQECLMNAAKHANSKEIVLEIKELNSKIILSIKDNGIGFNSKQELDENNMHYGLKILKDRVSYLEGDCSITSNENKGTTIKVIIPNNKG